MPRPTGIPRLERLIGRLLIRRWCRRNPPSRTLDILRRQQHELEHLIATAGALATTRIQIRRLPGLEHSSTNYSLAMIADHLARVNRDIAATIRDLAANRPSNLEVVIAAYKPDPGVQPAGALGDLDASIAALAASLSDLRAIERSTQTHPHPWFGALPARTWACFPSFHQAIHLKQAQLVASGLSRRALV